VGLLHTGLCVAPVTTSCVHVPVNVVDGVQLVLEPTLLHPALGKRILIHVFLFKGSS